MRTPLLALAALLCSCALPRPSPGPAAAEARLPASAELEPLGAAAALTVSAEAFAARCASAVEAARAESLALGAPSPDRGGAETLRRYDLALGTLSNTAARASVARSAHPEQAMREAAGGCEQQVEALLTELSQDRALYDLLAATDVSEAPPDTRGWLRRVLLDFRRAGVDRDAPTRGRVRELTEELTSLQQAFQRNTSEDVRAISFEPAELAGLPEDYLSAHPPGPGGKVSVTTDTPDYLPFMAYAQSEAARERLWRAYRSRGHPANEAVLARMLEARHQLATLLGYESWAAYATEDKMVGSAAGAADFIERIEAASRPRGELEHRALWQQKRRLDPEAKRVEPWDYDFLEAQVRTRTLGFDAQEARPYFEYRRVKEGVLETTGRMFGIEYRPVPGAPSWHPEVEVYDVVDREGSRTLGRIYLDMHPRPAKYKHAAQFTVALGQAGLRLPEGALLCNFPRPGELMEHGQVETFFHEFGHLLHAIFGGQQRWAQLSGVATEWDFVEAPSMLLQQWALDPEVLGTFARHHQTGEPLAPGRVAQLVASREFGKGLWTRRQMFLAAVSLRYHQLPPGFDRREVMGELQRRFEPFRNELRPGTHFDLSFGHLGGYSAVYYTYVWSQVIARDLQTVFEQGGGMLHPDPARRYRQLVLEPGGAKPAAALVEDFLGRPYAFDAYERWLNAD